MSFLIAAALALGVFVAAPVAAHLLRRGRAEEQEFPPAHLVPVAYRSARKKSRLEDRWLLLVRALLVFALAIVGAVPFVRCSRLALDRDAGASVALALVIDDSLSMRSRVGDTDTRWEVALKGARDLLKSTREGDAVGIVLAGEPARLALAATTDLGVVRETLDKLKPADRSTDLRSAIRLAESSLKALPHVDKRIAVLSDFAGNTGKLPDRALWIPLPELRQPAHNCGIAQARKEGLRVVANVACTAGQAGKDRTLRLVAGKGPTPNRDGAELAKIPLKPQAGSQRLELELSGPVDGVDAFLSAGDALPQDDYAAVAEVQGAMLIGVVADPATAAAQEGTATVLEQALNALTSTGSDAGPTGEVRPLPLIPEDEKELAAYSAFIIDDPPGLAPESRTALTAWMNTEAGFAAAFLGPNVEAAQLGASFEPFAHGALTWETTTAASIVDTSGLMGDAGASLKDIAPRGRLLLAGALIPGSETTLAWDDQSPWMLKRRVGRGQAWTFGLPVSVDQSDLALRPGFLALLERFLHDAAQAKGERVSDAGTTWRLADTVKTVEGPGGKLEPTAGPSERTGGSDRYVTPDLRGRYRIAEGNADFHDRIVTLDEAEIVSQPTNIAEAPLRKTTSRGPPNVEVSREFGLLLLALLALELSLRVVSRLRLRNQNPA